MVLETSPPPSAPLIKCLELRGIRGRVSTYNDEYFGQKQSVRLKKYLAAEQDSSIHSGRGHEVVL
jgi:hypothetical protein